jgi:hypothetical protein
MANRWAQDIHNMLGIREIGQYLQVWRLIEHMQLIDEPEKMLWKWTTNCNYTALTYLASFQGSTSWRAWKTRPLPRVKLFSWLANLDRCWTADRVKPELMHHLIVERPLSRQAWH